MKYITTIVTVVLNDTVPLITVGTSQSRLLLYYSGLSCKLIYDQAVEKGN